jgi:hypothetical protein
MPYKGVLSGLHIKGLYQNNCHSRLAYLRALNTITQSINSSSQSICGLGLLPLSIQLRANSNLSEKPNSAVLGLSASSVVANR